MNEFALIIIVSMLVISLFMHYESQFSDLVKVYSDINKKHYMVRNREDKQDAANLLAKLSIKMDELVDKLIEEYSDDDRIKRLQMKFNSSNIRESMSSSKQTSYSINKGEKLVFCIRKKNENQTFIKLNTILFVAIHEIAHIITVEIGHTKTFWDNMKFLLKNAIKYGIYQEQDFKNNPEPYCGIFITSTPLGENDSKKN